MEKKFIKVRTITDIIIALVLLTAGIALVILPTSVAANIFGCSLSFIGLLLLICLKSGYRDADTGENYRMKIKYFPNTSKECILSALKNKIEDIDMSEEDKGTALMINVFYNKESQRAFICLYEYIPYQYHAISETYEYPADRIIKLIA